MPDSRLAGHEPVAQGLRRLLASEIEAAREALAGRTPETLDAVVHGVRKRLKVARTIVRTLKPALGDAAAPLADALRSAAHELGTARDAAVLAATAEAIAREFGPGPEQVLLAELARSARETAASVDEAAMADAADRHLAQAAALVTDLAPEDKAPQIGERIGQLYRRARDGWLLAEADPQADVMHEWRKRVKDRLALARLFQKQWPEPEAPHAKRLDRLGELLGEHHDLANLYDRLPFGAPGSVGIADEIRRRQHRLERKAFRLAADVFEAKPKAVRAAWRDAMDA